MCQVFKQKSEKQFHKENLKSLCASNPEFRLFLKNIQVYNLEKSKLEEFQKFLSEKKELKNEVKSWKSKYRNLLKKITEITKSLSSYNSKKSSNA
jgi:hypothetical protein